MQVSHLFLPSLYYCLPRNETVSLRGVESNRANGNHPSYVLSHPHQLLEILPTLSILNSQFSTTTNPANLTTIEMLIFFTLSTLSILNLPSNILFKFSWLLTSRASHWNILPSSWILSINKPHWLSFGAHELFSSHSSILGCLLSPSLLISPPLQWLEFPPKALLPMPLPSLRSFTKSSSLKDPKTIKFCPMTSFLHMSHF